MSTNENKHPKGYWMNVGVSIGIAIGVALGPIFDNLGAGIGIGVAIGVGIGASLEQKYKDNIRPMTEQENKRQRWAVMVGLIILASVIAIAPLLFSRIK